MATTVFAEFPAGGPRGSWPAEAKAAEIRESGQFAEVVMDLRSDKFLVVAPTEQAGDH